MPDLVCQDGQLVVNALANCTVHFKGLYSLTYLLREMSTWETTGYC